MKGIWSASALVAVLCGGAFAETGAHECKMTVLPLGCVQPEGSLRVRLKRQARGLTGHAEELYPDIGKSDWLTNAGVGGEFAWERGPYYARGLVALACVLNDDGMKSKARKWVDAALKSQRPNGDFGPRKNNWWANMLPQAYLRDWADAMDDDRVVPFLERYYAYQEAELNLLPLEKESCWACARGGDELESVLWLFKKTGDARWIEFARRIASMTADWPGYYRVGGDPGRCAPDCGGYRCHIVNFMHGLKFPALKWRLYGDNADRSASFAAFDPKGWVVRMCGRPDGMINGSEPLTDRSASGGTELCAIAERIISLQTVLSVFGDASSADDLEDIVYNSLSAATTKDMKGICYYLLLNQPICVDKDLMFANNGSGTGANCPGPHSGYGCCRSNWHVAWPKFVQSMWMLRDDGIALVAHGPSSVKTRLSCGEVVLREETDYPRSGKITIRVVAGEGRFPIFVRIPRWAKLPDAGSFRRFDREWKTGDAVEMEFPMEVELTRWANEAVAVRRGPFLYSLRIGEDWKKVVGYPTVAEKDRLMELDGMFPRWEIRPTSPWNFALVLKDGGLDVCDVLDGGEELRVKAVRTEAAGWGYLRADAPGRAIDPPMSPVNESFCSKEETVSMVPMCETQLRITLFPWMKAR